MTDPHTDPDPGLPDIVVEQIRGHRDQFQRLGWILIVVGIVAILAPLVASIAIKLLVGWLMLISGGFTLYHAFQSRSWGSAVQSGLVGLLYLALGVYLAFFPLTGLVGLTFLMGVMFLAEGVFEAMIALQHRPRKGWGWLALSGVASGVLGVLMIAGLPGTALWALGLMLGLNLLSSGVAFVALARSV